MWSKQTSAERIGRMSTLAGVLARNRSAALLCVEITSSMGHRHLSQLDERLRQNRSAKRPIHSLCQQSTL
jgi:hypothetical protein